MKAYCLIREAPWYRREAFAAGLRAAGHDVLLRNPTSCDDQTLLIIWNRYPPMHELAMHVERAGGHVIVAENGYIGKGGGTPKFDVYPDGPGPGHYYALANSWHNGGGTWYAGGPERFDALSVQLKPWRNGGSEIVILPNRSFGVPGRMMPPDWPERAARRIQHESKMPTRIRYHPGNKRPSNELLDDLRNAHACVVWYSTAGVHALAEGIPVFSEAPYWICKQAAAYGSYLHPQCPDRVPAFQSLAWAQWTIDEIASGVPFTRLLEC